MIKQYLTLFILRCCLLLVFLYLYFVRPDFIGALDQFKLFGSFSFLHVLWIVWMVASLRSMFPTKSLSMGCRKQSISSTVDLNCQPEHLNKAKKIMNQGALKVLIVWLLIFFLIALFVWNNLFGPLELILCSLVFYVADLFCVVFWCPFQSWFMHNRCCVNCRIFNWDRLMIVTPLFFAIQSFFSWSLIAISTFAFFKWEYAYAKYPERFFEGSNFALRCKNCVDHMCQIKKPK